MMLASRVLGSPSGPVAASLRNGALAAAMRNGLLAAAMRNGLLAAAMRNGLLAASLRNGPLASEITQIRNASTEPTSYDQQGTGRIRTKLLNELRAVGFSTSAGEKILSTHPSLLSQTSLNKFSDCYANLRTIMPKGHAFSILQRSPLICLEDFSDLEKINDYVVDKMGIQYPEIARSKVLEHSLDHVRARHLFLCRAGLYELPNYQGETKDTQNPSLKMIVDSSDQDFVKMTGLSLEEYRVFRNILHLESQVLAPEDELDDDDGGDFMYSESGEQLYQKRVNLPPKPSSGRKKRRGKKR